jgi:hypothetical protein
MKAVLQTLQNQPCREREISENEINNFSNYLHLQRYHPALDIFKIPESSLSHKNIELPSKYYINSWIKPDESRLKIWDTTRTCLDNTLVSEPCKTFVKTVHLLNPIDLIKEKYIVPEHPLLPQSENTWKKTLTKLHSHNNQAYVDTVANFVLSRFRELNLTPHCILHYGATTGISKSYQFNISQEYDTYRQCRWFWKGMKSHSARLTVIRGDKDIEEIPNFEEIYKDITTCPFDDDDNDNNDDESDNIPELVPIIDKESDNSDIESIKSITFDNIEEEAENVKDIFEINKKITKHISSKKSESDSESGSESESESESRSESGSDSRSNSDSGSGSESVTTSNESVDLDIDICIEIPNMPVILIHQEAQEGVMDNLLDEDEIDGQERGSQGWEARWIAWLFQIIAALTFLQQSICFTHNDLHSNNIVWRATDIKFLYYKTKDGTIWRVPTFGKIFSIIDFGRAIFRLGKHLWVSDDHWPDQEAGDQYNFGPFFDHSKPKHQPNPSFDLSRLAISLIDGLFDDKPDKKKGKGVSIISQEGNWKVFETKSPLFNLLWSWTVNKDGETIYEDKDGNEKYEGFDLYIRIAQDVHNAVPKDQIHKPVFQQYKWKQKVPPNTTVYSIGI